MFQIQNQHTKEQECKHVIPLIAKAGQTIDMVVSRNPLADMDDPAAHHHHHNTTWETRAADGFAEETV